MFAAIRLGGWQAHGYRHVQTHGYYSLMVRKTRKETTEGRPLRD